ncbi:MAG: hypothetical protein QOG64_1220 [Acidimicrobiaceae bacterium]|nr:hypothetical protein [Acidimicrobiaceae bacterium]
MTGVAAGGDGLARDEGGMVVFVEGGLPGERVAVRVHDRRRDFSRGRVVDVVDPSPDRVEPPCPYVAAGCGGCQWQHISPDGQRRLKIEIVRDALRRLAHIPDPTVAPEAVAVADHGYRTTLRLAVDGVGRPSYRRRHAHDLVPVDACLIAHPLLADLVVSARFPGAKEVLLRVSAATGERIARPEPRSVVAEVAEDVVIGGRIHEEVAGRSWRVSAGSFFQSGPAGAGALAAAVVEAAGDALANEGVIVDAYAGVGLLGGVAAGERHRIVAVESNPVAARDAKANLAGRNARVHSVDVGSFRPGPEPAALVIADPARTGLGRPGVRALSMAHAPVLVLVSCDPASLARDVVLLGEAGYRLAATTVVDLFPHTVHVETVSRFEQVREA